MAFDLLARGDESLMDTPFGDRRAGLEELAGTLGAPICLTQTTTDVELARRWLEEFEGAGFDGVVAKPLDAAYEPGKRRMLKVKHHRTADVVVLGYRIRTSDTGVGSLLLRRYDSDGELRSVGGASAFTDKRRQELIDELEPFVLRDESGKAVTGVDERSRFSSGKDVSYVRLEPKRVVEVRYDQMDGSRFRHTAQFFRWPADRDARSCTFEQLEVPVAYDLPTVLVGRATTTGRFRMTGGPGWAAPGRFAGHLRAVRRERKFAEAGVKVALPPAEQFVDRAGAGVELGPRGADGFQPLGYGTDRVVRGVCVV